MGFGMTVSHPRALLSQKGLERSRRKTKTMSKQSKFLSLVLRHQPELIGIELDPQGWTSVETLLVRASAFGAPMTRAELEAIVAESDKKRFTLSEDGSRIRAAQGHSVPVDLGVAPMEPPEVLYHGTATRFLAAIRAEGLIPGRRQQVHLSPDIETAIKVGQRHGKAQVLLVAAGRMFADGFAFTRADNGVWLTDHVPPSYLAEKD